MAISRQSRRALIGGFGAGAAVVGAGLIYRISPFFWRRWVKELGRAVAPPPARPDPARWPDQGLHLAWIGHSTVLMKIDGFTILTDPVFSTRIGLSGRPRYLRKRA